MPVNYSYYDLNKLIYNPESEEKTAMTNKFNPKPGDKIICNNGAEFICCTLELLREAIYEGIKSDKPILGYRKFGYEEEWQDWDEHGNASYDYGIREVIPQSSEVTAHKKEEVKEEPRYTVEEVLEAIQILTPTSAPWSWVPEIKEHLNKVKDPQYLEYLRLKAIYE